MVVMNVYHMSFRSECYYIVGRIGCNQRSNGVRHRDDSSPTSEVWYILYTIVVPVHTLEARHMLVNASLI